MKETTAIILAVSIGAACRFFSLPVPSPPKLFGALLVVAITAGYVLTDHLLKR